MRLIPSCQDLARAAADGSYAEGAWHVRARLRLHMVSCWICRRYLAQLAWIERTSKQVWASEADENAGFKSRLLRRLKS